MSKTPEYRPSQEDLLGYLLGALDEAEQERVKRYVAGHPEIQAELGKLQRCMLPLRMVDMPIEPPGGLARRSCEQIFAQAENWAEPRRTAVNESAGVDGWQIWDLTMLMSVAVLMAMLIMPAVYRSREAARRLACASNLRHLSYAMRSHSEMHGGRLPTIPMNGPAAVAGSYALRLKSLGLLPFDHVVLCPSTDSSACERPFSIPTMDELLQLEGEPLLNVQRQLGGSYGFDIGRYINGVLVAAKDEGREYFAILSDAPEHSRGLGLVTSHAGNGRNVLFESGRISFVDSVKELSEGMDDYFHDRFSRLAPGADCNDAVLVESGMPILSVIYGCESN